VLYFIDRDLTYFQYHKRIERSTSNGEILIANPENGSEKLYYTMSWRDTMKLLLVVPHILIVEFQLILTPA